MLRTFAILVFAFACLTLPAQNTFSFQDNIGFLAVDGIQSSMDGGLISVGRQLVGAGTYEMAISKVGLDGNLDWHYRRLGPGTIYDLVDISECANGDLLVCGFVREGSLTARDHYVSRIDTGGNMIWEKRFHAGREEISRTVVEGSNGEIFLCGISYLNSPPTAYHDIIKLNAAGDTLWTKSITQPGYNLGFIESLPTPDGGMIIGGQSRFVLDYQGSLMKVDSTGEVEWHRQYDFGSGTSLINSVELSPNGGYYVGGYTDAVGFGHFDAWLMETNFLGQPIWSRVYGTANLDQIADFKVRPDGGLIGVGRTLPGTGQDLCLLMTDSVGQLEQVLLYNNSTSDRGDNIENCPAGGYFITGSTDATTTDEFWFLKTDENGEVLKCPPYSATWAVVQQVPTDTLLTTSRLSGMEEVSIMTTTSVPGGAAVQLNCETILSVDPSSEASPGIAVAPHPVSDRLAIHLDQPVVGHVQFQIFDLKGRLLLAFGQDLTIPEFRLELPVEGLASGMYLLELNSQDQLIRTRFLKQ